MIQAGAPFLRFDEIDSTNEEARRRAVAGDDAPCWIIARVQQAGRGRRGRSWLGGEGNLFLTYYGVSDRPPAEIALLGFAAGVALAETLAEHVAPDRIALKWPNDLIIDGGKAAGILLESGQRAGGGLWFAVGVGLNVVSAPDTDQRTAALAGAMSGAAPETEKLADSFAIRLADKAEELQRAGFGPLRAQWLRRAIGIGARAVAHLPNETIEGRAAGVSLRGELELTLPDGGMRLISAGDVFFPDLALV